MSQIELAKEMHPIRNPAAGLRMPSTLTKKKPEQEQTLAMAKLHLWGLCRHGLIVHPFVSHGWRLLVEEWVGQGLVSRVFAAHTVISSVDAITTPSFFKIKNTFFQSFCIKTVAFQIKSRFKTWINRKCTPPPPKKMKSYKR